MLSETEMVSAGVSGLNIQLGEIDLVAGAKALDQGQECIRAGALSGSITEVAPWSIARSAVEPACCAKTIGPITPIP